MGAAAAGRYRSGGIFRLTEDMMQCASELAAQSAVLLKNEHTLPLVNQKKIAVVGPLAKNARSLIGNWAGYGRDEDVDVLYNGIVQEFSTTSEVRYAEGCGLESQHDADPKRGWSAITDTIAHEVEALAEAVSLAQWSDVVVVCLGEKAGWSGENCSRSSIALPRCQEQLVEAVKQTGKPVVIVLSNGRPIELCRIEPMADAIISIWQPGVNGASALAGILSGRINPSGKLAVTFPYTTGQEPIYYNLNFFFTTVVVNRLLTSGIGEGNSQFTRWIDASTENACQCRSAIHPRLPDRDNSIGHGLDTTQLYRSAIRQDNHYRLARLFHSFYQLFLTTGQGNRRTRAILTTPTSLFAQTNHHYITPLSQ